MVQLLSPLAMSTNAPGTASAILYLHVCTEAVSEGVGWGRGRGWQFVFVQSKIKGFGPTWPIFYHTCWCFSTPA